MISATSITLCAALVFFALSAVEAGKGPSITHKVQIPPFFYFHREEGIIVHI
jgi:hypothetical protein